MKESMQDMFTKYRKHLKGVSLLNRRQILDGTGLVLWEEPEDEYQRRIAEVDTKLVELWNRVKKAQQEYDEYVESSIE